MSAFARPDQQRAKALAFTVLGPVVGLHDFGNERQCPLGLNRLNTMLSRCGTLSLTRFYSRTSFLVNSFMLHFHYLRYCQNALTTGAKYGVSKSL